MNEYPEEQDEALAGAPGAGQTRLQQFLSQLGSPAQRYREAAQQQQPQQQQPQQQQPQQQQPQQDGGIMNRLIDKIKGPLPPLPDPPKPPGPPNGAALSPQYQLVQAQDAARNDPKNQPAKNGDTYCNIATYQTAQAMGAPMDPFMTSAPVSKTYPKGSRPGMANEIADKLKNSKDYRVVTAAEAQALANQGKLVVAVQPHPQHGHVATVRPDNLYNENAPTAGTGPVMNNVGMSVGVRRAKGATRDERAFRPGSEPIYYTPANSK